MENLEKIKLAIDVEVKHRYIDIHGKKQAFSSFIKNIAKENYKNSKKNPKWAVMIETFEHYPFASVPERRRAIESLVKVIKSELIQKDEPKTSTPAIKRPANQTDVMYIKGVGPKVAYKLNKLGIYTAQDLIMYFPKKHVDYSSRTLIRDLKEGTTTTVFGYIKSVSAFNTKNNLSVVKVTVADESGKFELNFFQSKSNRFMLERIKAQFPHNAGIMVSGTVKMNNYSRKLTIDKPTYSIMTGEFLENSASNLNVARIVPIYTVCEDLSIKTLRRAIYNAIQLYKNDIINIIPGEIRERLGLLDKKTAVEQIHFPESMDILERARFTLIFEELFLVQLKLIRLRENTTKNTKSVALNIKKDGLVQKFIRSLPFELTKGQKDAVNEILNDLHSDAPMQRLLQGDVGSGKTVVATIMLLAAVENGYQGAMMAPTEILAIQHFDKLKSLLEPLGINVAILTGSLKAKQRRDTLEGLADGAVDIVIGTHALIQDNVIFKNLGLVVTDEQHRFGVNQRAKLEDKGIDFLPDVLVMTATPIPRTMTLTVYGDLDVSFIRQLPPGRKPIRTFVRMPDRRELIYKFVRNEVAKGRQAYVVCPLIEESENSDAVSVEMIYDELTSGFLYGVRCALLHGKLAAKDKEQLLYDFLAGKIDVLISTTVIEVGVNVPNASIMVIEGAERFGLAQLHQLRGRIGRGQFASYCILVNRGKNANSLERLHLMEKISDGFVLAEEDLRLRGPGQFFGSMQHGLPDLKIADVLNDVNVLITARREAQRAIDFGIDRKSLVELLQLQYKDRFIKIADV